MSTGYFYLNRKSQIFWLFLFNQKTNTTLVFHLEELMFYIWKRNMNQWDFALIIKSQIRWQWETSTFSHINDLFNKLQGHVYSLRSIFSLDIISWRSRVRMYLILLFKLDVQIMSFWLCLLVWLIYLLLYGLNEMGIQTLIRSVCSGFYRWYFGVLKK